MTTTPRTWVVGEVVTAAELNTEIRDQWNSILGAWSTYTVTWTGSTTNPVLGNGTLIGRYLQVGRRYDVHIDLTAGSSTTYGSGGWAFSLPATAASVGSRVGHAHALQSASQRYGGQCIIGLAATNTSPFCPTGTTPLAQVAAGVPFTWASGNQLRLTFTYESAT